MELLKVAGLALIDHPRSQSLQSFGQRFNILKKNRWGSGDENAFRPVSDLKSHAQLKMFRPGIRAGVFIWEEFEKF